MKMKRILAVGVILLFVGVTIAPTINFNTVKASQEDDLIEVTSQACGIKGYRDTTVKLTREQYQDLQEYLVEFRARLNQTSTREEAVPLFKEAVVELDRYGLLPKGMSVERAQNLVLSGIAKDFPSTLIRMNSNTEGIRDLFCLISGEGTNTFFQSAFNTVVIKSMNLIIRTPLMLIYALCIILYFYFKLNGPLLNKIFYLANYLSMRVDDFFFFLTSHTGASVFNIIRYSPYDLNGSYQSIGWVQTIGINGKQTMNGSFYGRFPTWPTGFFWVLGNPGVIGFTGLRVNIEQKTHKSSYFGSAMMVAIDYYSP